MTIKSGHTDKRRETRLTAIARAVIFLVSLILLCALVIEYGFQLDEVEKAAINAIFTFSIWFYFVLYLLIVIFRRKQIVKRSIIMTVSMALLLIYAIISNHLTPALLVFSIVELSRGIVNFIGKKTNPALLLSTAFLVITAIGTIILLVPRSTLPDVRLSVADALFVSTSALCVTGLSPVDISSTFTVAGQTVILFLIQIGALGVMTITSAFALFFMGETSIINQFALRDVVGSDTFSSLISTLLYILGFTFAIETAGFFSIWLSIHNTLGMSVGEELFFSAFHSISAFCNAGFSTLGGNLGNPALIHGHNIFYLTISILVIFGGIGFPTMVNLANIIMNIMRRIFKSALLKSSTSVKFSHLENLNTRIVLDATLFLIIGGTIIIALLEWNGAFAEMTTSGKLVHSFFNSVSPRTAGFNSVDLTLFSPLSIIFYTLLMWIGGASQSTAGGVKVNTIMVAVANFRSILKGRESIVLYNREIDAYSVKRASAIIFGSLATIFIFWIALIVAEPQLRPYKLFFEVVSAISTVGSTLDVTPMLGTVGKLLISLLMFIGRVGLMTVLMSLMHNGRKLSYKYPVEKVIIN
ncbi:MAG: potassium transporter [Bacteroidales bacterium]|nr:potassium transporter [Bacteroidales bacterium]